MQVLPRSTVDQQALFIIVAGEVQACYGGMGKRLVERAMLVSAVEAETQAEGDAEEHTFDMATDENVDSDDPFDLDREDSLLPHVAEFGECPDQIKHVRSYSHMRLVFTLRTENCNKQVWEHSAINIDDEPVKSGRS